MRKKKCGEKLIRGKKKKIDSLNIILVVCLTHISFITVLPSPRTHQVLSFLFIDYIVSHSLDAS